MDIPEFPAMEVVKDGASRQRHAGSGTKKARPTFMRIASLL